MDPEPPDARPPAQPWAAVLLAAILVGALLISLDIAIEGPLSVLVRYFFGGKSFG